MKLVLFGQGQPGVVTGRGVVDVSEAVQNYQPRNGEEAMEAIIVNWDAVKGDLARLE